MTARSVIPHRRISASATMPRWSPSRRQRLECARQAVFRATPLFPRPGLLKAVSRFACHRTPKWLAPRPSASVRRPRRSPMGKAIGDDAKRRLARGDSKERPKEIVIRSRRPLSSTEKRKSRFTITIDDGAAMNRVPTLPPDVGVGPSLPLSPLTPESRKQKAESRKLKLTPSPPHFLSPSAYQPFSFQLSGLTPIPL